MSMDSSMFILPIASAVSIPAAHSEASGVGLSGALGAELVPGEVGVVRGVDPVVREGAAHVLAHLPMRGGVE